jgi:putative zinc finger protein/fervidolysin-like protein
MAAPRTPHDAAALLPWYLSGTLPAADRAVVAAHLETCDACRRELAALERLKTAVGAAVEARPAPARDLFARVAARVGAEPRGSWWTRLADRAGALLAPRLAPALAVGLIAVQFGALALLAVRLYQVVPGEHTTQSGSAASGPAAAGTRLRLAFQDGATALEIRSALESVGAQIVEGPSAAGFYVVVVPPATDAARAIETLRSRGAVRFVEPIRS